MSDLHPSSDHQPVIHDSLSQYSSSIGNQPNIQAKIPHSDTQSKYFSPSHHEALTQPRPALYSQDSPSTYSNIQNCGYSSPYILQDDKQCFPNKSGVKSSSEQLNSNSSIASNSHLPEKQKPYVQNGPNSILSGTHSMDSNVLVSSANPFNTLPHLNGVSSTAQIDYFAPKTVAEWPSHVKIPPPPGSAPSHLPYQQNIVPGPGSSMHQYGNITTQPIEGYENKTVPNTSSVPLSGGLPLPFGTFNTGSSSPHGTPGTSQPPSARSSRDPSPISTQRYDYMEGQFSNKSSPSGSATNLQNLNYSPRVFNSVNFPSNQLASNKSTCDQLQTNSLSAEPYGHPTSVPVYNQSPITSQPVQNTTLPPVAPTSSVRPRYLHPSVGYQSPSPLANLPGSVQTSPLYNATPQMPSPQYQLQSGLPEGPVGGVSGYDPQLHAKMAGLSVHGSFSRLWGNDSINLLQDRNILPAIPLESPKPALSIDKPNCSPNIFRCTLTKVPDTSALLQKSRLPFGILIHPFRDISNLPVIQCSTIVRCRNCRTYINPFVTFVDHRRWKCNLCFRYNDLPEEFLYDPTTKSYGEPTRRPEVRNATMEFVAPSDYMLRPPQPAVYLFLLDVSHGACEIGYLQYFCKVLLDSLEELPGDSRTRIGFITYDGNIHFYNLTESLNQPHMLVVSDIDDIFLPSPDNLLVSLHESRGLICDLLEDLPKRFSSNPDSNCSLGSALQAAFKLMSPFGGRVTVIQTCLANTGPGALKNREDPNLRAAKDVTNIGPANDFYKKLALECSGQQIAVDLFLLCSQYVDVATISCISKFSSGCVQYYPGFHSQLGKVQVDRFISDIRRYLTRRIGFEAVMRIRCTRGLAIHTFHGNFFVRSTDLLSLPNVTPDVGFGMQISIEESLVESNTACFQAAVLYTSSSGERRIRVHTLCLPVVSLLNDVLGGADQEAIIGLVSKMAVDRSVASSLSDARDALINVSVDMLGVFKQTLQAGQTAGTLMAPYSTRLIPLFILALLKHMAFRTGISTKLDERVFAMERMKTLPLTYLMKYVYPTLYPVHALDDKNAIHQDDDAIIPQPVILQLSSEKLDRHGAYVLDTFDIIYLYVGRAISDHFCVNVLGVPNFNAIVDNSASVPELHTPESERLRNFVSWLQEQKPSYSPIKIIREDSPDRHSFLQYMIDDRTESLFSYYEFLQHLRNQVSK